MEKLKFDIEAEQDELRRRLSEIEAQGYTSSRFDYCGGAENESELLDALRAVCDECGYDHDVEYEDGEVSFYVYKSFDDHDCSDEQRI